MSKSNKSKVQTSVVAAEYPIRQPDAGVSKGKRQKPVQAPKDQPEAAKENARQIVTPTKKRGKKADALLNVSLNTQTHVGGVAFTTARPGVIAVMIEHLSKATSEHPVTKETILDDLVVRFPDRTREKMKSTLMMQVPSGLRTEKRIVVRKSEDKSKPGYYIDAQATAALQAEWKAQTGK